MAGLSPWVLKRRVIRHYDRIARLYNALYGHEQNQKISRALSSLRFKPFEAVLDVGCGTGLLFKHIGMVDSVDFIVGVDIARGPLMVARETVKSSGLSKVHLVRADADFLPFRDGVFDKVFAITLLQNMPDYICTLKEVARVSKNDATIIVTGLKKVFSRESFTFALEEAGLKFHLLDDSGGDIKCHIAVCSKTTAPENINRREVEIIAGW